MQGDRVWVLEDPDERPRVRKTPAVAPPRRQTNPAVAFTLSLLIWGAGQIYNRQGKSGFLLILLMVNFYMDPVLIWVYRESFTIFLGAVTITSSQLLMVIGAFYCSGLIVWLFNAEHAYYGANKTRTEAFRGIESAFLPAACSLLIPGWGQFLNGQARKGTLFLMFALIGLVAVPALLIIPFFWPRLDTPADHLFWETILVAALVLSPLMLLIWPLNSFDALKVSRDDTKKEPVLKRLEYANNRRRMYGWGRGVFPYFKQTLVLGLFLALCLTVAYYQFPREYYAARLQSLQVQLSRQQMVLIPRLIDRFLQDVLHRGSS
jgi:TM2 domain-containing membrane protein YozV